MTAIQPPPIPEPIWLTIAIAELGVKETAGTRDTARIVEYLRATNLPPKMWHDSTAHCAAFVSWCLGMAGLHNPRFAQARSFLSYGTKLQKPRGGCIVVFSRPPDPNHGHVAFFPADQTQAAPNMYRVLGANQRNQVCYADYPMLRAIGFRWPV
jgi:uncharacterized protein (TIGR02594 family)